MLLVEGIPPIPARMVERIRSWQYVDLAELLVDPTAKSEETTWAAAAGQVVLVQSMDQLKKRRRQITDIASWIQAFSVYVAALATAESTSKEELAGLMAHVHVILQVYRDLGGLKWYNYDQQFREWAAAVGKRSWGEVNLTIYGRCLCTQSRAPPQANTGQHTPPKRESKKQKGKNKACFKHNFEASCSRAEADCHYDHICWYCGLAEHIAGDCPKAPKRRRA